MATKGFGKAIKSIENIENSLTVLSKLKGAKSTIKSDFDADISDAVSKLNTVVKDLKTVPQKIQKAHDLAMLDVAQSLKDALDEAMEANIWQWTNDTRDIIDTGALRDSGKVTYNRSSQRISISYGEEYAAIVHYGGEITSGFNPEVRIFYPARPWIESTLKGLNGIEKFPMAAIYLAAFEKYLKS